MSESYILFKYFDDLTVDLITSLLFYLFQAICIIIFIFCLKRYNHIFNKKRTFIILLIIGVIPMLMSMLINNGMLITFFSLIFNLLIGIYFGYYITLLARYVPKEKTGLYFGIAYAIGSIGTYILSLVGDGNFIINKEASVVYLILCAFTIYFVQSSDDLDYKSNSTNVKDIKYLNYMVIIVVLICSISILGSNLYYSLPTSSNVNWYFIRSFYSFGLIIAGFIIDKKRSIGEIVVIASLTYPLISSSLLSGGFTNTLVLSLSYAFRGFITIYYVIVFSDLYHDNKDYLYLAPFGLFISRITEVIITFILMHTNISNTIVLIFSALLFIPLLIIFNHQQFIKYHNNPINDDRRLALFSERYQLTNREMEIITCLKEGLSDNEIADKYFISKNTVRFHISNILKKTNCNSRVEIIRNLNKFEY